MAITTTTICRRRRLAMLRRAPQKMTRTMSISFPLISTENIWGKCETVRESLFLSQIYLSDFCKYLKKTTFWHPTRKLHFCSFAKPRKLHGVDHNGRSLETPEFGIVNYIEWMDNVSRYLLDLYFHSPNSCWRCADGPKRFCSVALNL